MKYVMITLATMAAVASGAAVLAHESHRGERSTMDHCMSMMGEMSHDGMMEKMPGMMGMGRHGMRGNDQIAQADTVHKGTGKVNTVDSTKGVVNLSHGPIKSIGWSSMRMDFIVSDPSLLRGIEPGNEVEFELRQESPSKNVITRIEKKS